MELYKQEFGQNFDLGFSLKKHPYLIDKSWHNDQCPSFYFIENEKYYVLWVDYAEEEQREEDTSRYIIVEAINEGDNEVPEVYAGEGKIAFECEVITELEEWLEPRQTSNPSVNL
ncbi:MULTISPECIES: hypothetical protein [unclassified Pseudoalteromonas]|uniref:hypothetical protein n=1 Tax=unclassified Pseudoalteromonas TaxID=194690 RepID=UPI002359550E|nr:MULTISPECIES: hypothetical protein [unclassified Pseudoalteromonas]MDC9565693.1 hypothetical protein [Pseudoalteromonas sp. GAB2316C]MDC9570024.1 hypothetical protein [Pseudoalteromonas sp. GABNB9D]MDC9574135.1 hypothetical protein [Pseudoalteromonas sp. GABNS16A]MDC9578498.1 hypothetical protein [Pseudoalteromonas sp. GABNS16E]MDC9586078.1 hypothetical protein [Pseudoalteromonas sp. GABNS16C]